MSDILDSLYGGSQELDQQLAAAGETLQKIADDNGVDLNELSDDDVAELLGDLMGHSGGGESGEEEETGGEEASGEEQETGEQEEGQMSEQKAASAEIPEQVTHADVAAELSKIASAEGIDLSSLPREDYHRAYDELAQAMAQPDYQEKQAAAQEKIAEADALGRQMAHSFHDELTNIQKKASAGGDRSDAYHALKGAVNEKRASAEGQTKKSFDEAATERARAILMENGIDPDRGVKLAESYDEAVEKRAYEMLKEHGYIED